MNDIKLISPLSITECKAILSEQVEIVSILRYINIFRRHRSRLIGKIQADRLILKYAFDAFSLSLKCTLTESNGQTILNGYWDSSILSDIWGFPKTDKEEILNFFL